jgi:hypothetical protein
MNRLFDKKSLCTLLIIGLASLTLLKINMSQANSLRTTPSMNTQQQYGSTKSIRDPFTPSELMFDTMSIKGSNSGTDSYGFMRITSDAKLPKMRLRGYIGIRDDKPVALLEVDDNRTFIIHEGDEINIDPSVPNSAIRITKITRFSITVEAGMLGSIRVQR